MIFKFDGGNHPWFYPPSYPPIHGADPPIPPGASYSSLSKFHSVVHVICTSSEGHLHVVCRDREANSIEDPKLYTINFLKLKDCSCIKNEFHYFRKLQTHLHIYGHHLRVVSTSFARHRITRMLSEGHLHVICASSGGHLCVV